MPIAKTQITGRPSAPMRQVVPDFIVSGNQDVQLSDITWGSDPWLYFETDGSVQPGAPTLAKFIIGGRAIVEYAISCSAAAGAFLNVRLFTNDASGVTYDQYRFLRGDSHAVCNNGVFVVYGWLMSVGIYNLQHPTTNVVRPTIRIRTD